MPPEPFLGRLARPGEEGSLCGVSTCVLGAGCGELVEAGGAVVVVPPPIDDGMPCPDGGCCPGGVTVTEGAPHMLLPLPAKPSPPADFPLGEGPPPGGGVGGVVGGGVAGCRWTWVPGAAAPGAGWAAGDGGGGGPSCCCCC